MKRTYAASALLWLIWSLLASPAAIAQTDAFQRVIKIHNSLDQTIYPVIQSPQDLPDPTKAGSKGTNCATSGLLRIVVNQGKEGVGIPSKQTVTVKVPKDRPCDIGGFYDASRIYILVANFDAFEKLLNDTQKTQRYPNWDYVNYNPCDGCYVGKSEADYGHDAPGQLLEYTMISQDPSSGAKFPDPNKKEGLALLDFDVSYVDDAYLPVAMAIDDSGATPFMGSTLGYTVFNQRLTDFLRDGNWSRYAAYAPQNWSDPDQCTNGVPNDTNKTRFSCLTARTDRVPSANILITDAQTGGTSAFYRPAWDKVTRTECNTAGTPDPTANLKCSYPRPDGDGLTSGQCCPDTQKPPFMQGCCDLEKFLIDNTHRKWDTTTKVFHLSNDTLKDAVKRWTTWQGAANNPCKDSSSSGAVAAAPVKDKSYFCASFKKTVDFIWKEFAPQCPKHGDASDRCITAAVIGYDLKNSTFDASQCMNCPNEDEKICPRQCALELQRNESVQALQRGLPWTPPGDPTACAVCPDSLSCPTSCIEPKVASAAAKLYHRDKFLHFWADYKSIYNLNPFARFVHNPDNGLYAPGAYSFSIDDFYGNFGGPGSTLLIDVGDIKSLPNQDPFDPFKQYVAGMGTGWDHATVCDQRRTLPPATPAKVGLSSPFSFWTNSVQRKTCEVRLFATADESKYIAFQVEEMKFPVTDDYTGLQKMVQGLSGVYANRFEGDSPPDDPYCMSPTNSTDRDLVNKGFCRANLSSGKLNLEYVGVSDEPCRGKNYNATCGKPLITINTPSLKPQPPQ